jgi:hypothetical protein
MKRIYIELRCDHMLTWVANIRLPSSTHYDGE